MTSRVPIGQLLVERGYIDPVQLTSGLGYQRRWGGRLGDALVNLRLISERALLTEIARQHGVRYIEIGDRYVPPQVLRLLPERLIRARRVLPIGLVRNSKRGQLFVATTEPQNLPLLDEVAFATGLTVEAVLVADRDLDRAIARHFAPLRSPKPFA